MQIIAENLIISRGQSKIIDDLSWTLSSGTALLLTGPNGAGKTTLIRAVAGFIPLTAGRFELAGSDPDREFAEHCHYVGHANGIKQAFTVAENLRFWAEYLNAGDLTGHNGYHRAVDTALERFNLTSLADIPAGYLSAGQKRRLGLARLLVAPRPIWLLDEPSVSLDAFATKRLAAVIGEHLANDGLVLAATHIPLGLEDAQELRLGLHTSTAPGLKKAGGE